LALAIAGATLISASSLTVVMAQEILPHRVGLASGLTLGLAFGAGGLGTTGLGVFADNFGLSGTMLVLVFLPLPVVILSLILPSGKPGPGKTSLPVEQDLELARNSK
jgi:FSR family fosmidomycin resistance protein-like MFS transporter